MQNYIGVTGISNISDCEITIRNFQDAGINLESHHIPMIGFLVIPKTLEGIPPNEGKIPHQRYPPVSSIKYIMEYSKNYALNMIHFGAKRDSKIGEHIINLFNKTGIYKKKLCRALQLNVEWPEERELEEILNSFPEMSIVLQIPKTILQNEENESITKKLKNYGSLIHGALIDPSGGKGKKFNLDQVVDLYQEIKKMDSKLIVGFAGGLNGTTVGEKITQIKSRINSSNFSIDAEEGLRVHAKKDGNTLIDMLEPNLVKDYINSASKSFN